MREIVYIIITNTHDPFHLRPNKSGKISKCQKYDDHDCTKTSVTVMT